MTAQLALSIVYGITECESLDQAEEVIAFFENHPEYLTNGQASRGLNQLRAAVFGNQND